MVRSVVHFPSMICVCSHFPCMLRAIVYFPCMICACFHFPCMTHSAVCFPCLVCSLGVVVYIVLVRRFCSAVVCIVPHISGNLPRFAHACSKRLVIYGSQSSLDGFRLRHNNATQVARSDQRINRTFLQ